jgi:hypothetical protein
MKRIIAIAFLGLFFGGVALAQEPKKADDGYQQVNGDMLQPGETMPASRLVAGAYGFICAAMIVYVASVARRARRLEDEVDALKKKIQARG